MNKLFADDASINICCRAVVDELALAAKASATKKIFGAIEDDVSILLLRTFMLSNRCKSMYNVK